VANGFVGAVGDADGFGPTTLAVGRVASRFSVGADNGTGRVPDNAPLEARDALEIGGGVVMTSERGADVALTVALIWGGLRRSVGGAAAREKPWLAAANASARRNLDTARHCANNRRPGRLTVLADCCLLRARFGGSTKLAEVRARRSLSEQAPAQ